MKKSNVLLSIIAMAILAIAVSIASCKKEVQNTTMGQTESVKHFDPRQIEDMNAYLTEFKLKMQSAAKGDDEALSLDDAAWHISSMANHDYANANAECDDIRFDTLHAHVNITNGTVMLSDLAEAYQAVSTSIEKFYDGLALSNKNFRFINTFISESGEVTVPLLTTFSLGSKDLNDTCWYFNSLWDAEVACLTYFSDYISYPAKTLGRSELERVLNLVISHPTTPTPGTVYFTESRTQEFDYDDYIDSFGSPFYLNSRLFASHGFLNPDIKNTLCYLFDSCLGLGEQGLQSNEDIISWEVYYDETTSGNPLYTSYYTLIVHYGFPTNHNNEGNDE